MRSSATPAAPSTSADAPRRRWAWAVEGGGGIWCCGSLRTAGVAVGVANLSCLLFLYLWLIQEVFLRTHQWIIAAACLTLVTFVFAVVNACLISGAVNRKRSFVLPWLLLYAASFLALVVSCGVAFKTMGALRPIAVAVVVLLAYFLAVVTSLYHQLLFEGRVREGAEEKGEERVAGVGSACDCLIALDDVTAAARLGNGRLALHGEGEADDTFSELVRRPKLLASNPFKADVERGSSCSSDDEAQSSRAPFLPKPDEVILVEQDRGDDVFVPQTPDSKAASTAAASFFDSPFRPSSKAHSSDHLGPSQDALGTIAEAPSASAVDGRASLAVPSGSSLAVSGSSRPRGSASRSHSHSGLLLGDIDASFTPFKSARRGRLCTTGGGGGDAGEEGDQPSVTETPPKMTIFLPKAADDDDDEDEDSSEEEDSEEEAAKKVLTPPAAS